MVPSDVHGLSPGTCVLLPSTVERLGRCNSVKHPGKGEIILAYPVAPV